MDQPSPAPESSDSTPGISLGRIEVINAVLILVLALVFQLWSGAERAVGVLAGGAISASSFRVVAVVMRRIVTPKRTDWWPVAVFWLKYMALIAAVGVLILKYKLDVIGFLVGVTLIVPSILMEAVLKGMAREEQRK